jgi:hypothetical protein
VQATRLRCRPGDLALVIRDSDAGKVVTCIELADESERSKLGMCDLNGPVWRIDRDCMWADHSSGGLEIPLPYCPDSALMPIRPEPDGEHEESAQETDLLV